MLGVALDVVVVGGVDEGERLSNGVAVMDKKGEEMAAAGGFERDEGAVADKDKEAAM